MSQLLNTTGEPVARIYIYIVVVGSKVPTFLKTIDGTKAVLENHIANNVIFVGLNIGAVRTDNGGDFESCFHRKLDMLGISRHLYHQTSNSKMASLRGR